ncbi:MAG: Uma2 family endonuclease, partial [Gemmatimonadales bacterium]
LPHHALRNGGIAMSAPLSTRRFTVDEYHRMAEAGILDRDERVELLDGEIIVMSPIGSRHAAAVDRLNHGLTRRAGQRAIVRVQNPIVLGSHGEPQPDVCLLKPRADFYAGAHPRAEDVLLVVEVADTSDQDDRERKIPAYARAGIPEAWLVALPADAVEVYREPMPEGYREVRRLERGATLTPLRLPELTLAVDDVLGPRPH